MAIPPDLSIILPAYNEAQRIGQLMTDLRRYLNAQQCDYEIIVCADGDDGTRELVLRHFGHDQNVTVQGSIQRRGKGCAIREGVSRARGRVIGFLDADNKVPVEELGKVLPWLERGYDVVIGSRAQPDSRILREQPWYRRLGSRGFLMMMHLLVGLEGIRDTQCGFKFFRADVARRLFARQRIRGYMFDVEILYRAVLAGYRTREVGIRWRYDGDSRLDLLRGNCRNLLDLFRIRFGRRVLPFPHDRAEQAPIRCRTVRDSAKLNRG